MASKININKTQVMLEKAHITEQGEKIQKMEVALRHFFYSLEKPNDQFKVEDAFNELLEYVILYERVLYSTISNIIYNQYDNFGNFDPAGTILSNLESLVEYSGDASAISAKKQVLPKNANESAVDDTRKVIIKIFDHVTLARQQYIMLKESDEEYDDKFKKRIATYKEEMSKDMNTQMITMVGIFTALAFLIFGSISSLDGVFENIEFPLFKIACIGLIWGICMANMVFVFLYCIGKMTKLNFKAIDDSRATIFERYPVVWWTNLILVSLLLLSSWGWFIQQSKIGEVLLRDLTNCSPWHVFTLGSIAILIIVAVGIVLLAKMTRFKETE